MYVVRSMLVVYTYICVYIYIYVCMREREREVCTWDDIAVHTEIAMNKAVIFIFSLWEGIGGSEIDRTRTKSKFLKKPRNQKTEKRFNGIESPSSNLCNFHFPKKEKKLNPKKRTWKRQRRSDDLFRGFIELSLLIEKGIDPSGWNHDQRSKQNPHWLMIITIHRYKQTNKEYESTSLFLSTLLLFALLYVLC